MEWMTYGAIIALVWFWIACIPAVRIERILTTPLLPMGWSGVLKAIPYAIWWLVNYRTGPQTAKGKLTGRRLLGRDLRLMSDPFPLHRVIRPYPQEKAFKSSNGCQSPEMLRWPASVSEQGWVFFEPPELLCLPDELDLSDGISIPNTSAGATPGAVPKQGGVSRVFRDERSDD